MTSDLTTDVARRPRHPGHRRQPRRRRRGRARASRTAARGWRLLSRSGDDLGLDGALGIACDVADREQVVRRGRARPSRELRRASTASSRTPASGCTAPSSSSTPEHLETMIDVNLKGTLYTAAATLPHLIAAGGGDFVSLASVAGLRAFPGEAVYNASKFGQVGFTRALDHELREHGVRATNICPGGDRDRLRDGHRPRRGLDRGMMSAEDVADTVVYCVTRPRELARADDELPADDRGLLGLSMRVGIAGYGLAGRGLPRAADRGRGRARGERGDDALAGARRAGAGGASGCAVVAELDELLERHRRAGRRDAQQLARRRWRWRARARARTWSSTSRWRRRRAEARRLLDARRAPDRLPQPALGRRLPDRAAAGRDGALGEVVRFESRFERFRPEVDPTRWREQARPSEGGGVLLDLGPHLVDQAVAAVRPAACASTPRSTAGGRARRSTTTSSSRSSTRAARARICG